MLKVCEWGRCVWWKCFAPVVCSKWTSAIPSRWMEPCSCQPWGQCLLMQQMQGELSYHTTISVRWRYGFMRKMQKEWFTRLSHYSVNPEISTLTSHRICTDFCDKQDLCNFYRFDKTDLHIQISKCINMKCAYPVNRKCNTLLNSH